jgi:hypothetical protein
MLIKNTHRCYKEAGREEGQRLNFGGFEDIMMRDVEVHQRNAILNL